MTFDETIEVLANSQNNKLVKEGQLAYGLYCAYDVVGMLQKLKEEYSPTVEMTKEQKRILDSYREPGLYEGDYAFYDETHDYRLSLRDTGLFDTITEKQLMQAWLNPNSIQIIDEE